MIAQLARGIRDAGPARAATEHIRQFAHGGEHVDQAEARHRAAHEVVRQQRPEERQRFTEIVPVPEGGPWDQDEQQAGFEQEGDDEETSEQGGLLFRLELRQPEDAIRHVAIVPRLGFELDEDGERAGQLA